MKPSTYRHYFNFISQNKNILHPNEQIPRPNFRTLIKQEIRTSKFNNPFLFMQDAGIYVCAGNFKRSNSRQRQNSEFRALN